MSSYQYRKPHCGDKAIARSSFLHHGISFTGNWYDDIFIFNQHPLPRKLLLHFPNKDRRMYLNTDDIWELFPAVQNLLFFYGNWNENFAWFTSTEYCIIKLADTSMHHWSHVVCHLHWGLNKMADILQTYSKDFSWMKMNILWFKFYLQLSSFLRVQLTFNRHWGMLLQMWPISLRHLPADTRGNNNVNITSKRRCSVVLT